MCSTEILTFFITLRFLYKTKVSAIIKLATNQNFLLYYWFEYPNIGLIGVES